MVDGIRGPSQFDRLFPCAGRESPFCAAAFLAECLGRAAGLSAWLSRPPRGDLEIAFAALGGRDRARLRAAFPEPVLRELLSLAREGDRGQLLEALYPLAVRLENDERLSAAASLFSALAELPEPSPLRARARARLDALLGRGAMAPRAEFLLRRLAAHSTEPGSLFGMLLAGGCFAQARLATMAVLGTAATHPLTRGLGARLLSGAAGLLLEAPAFVLGARGARAVLGPPPEPPAGILEELGGAYLSLGAMHLAGGLGRLGLGTLGTGARGAGILRLAVPPASLFGGLLLGRRLEEALGLRPSQEGATTFTDTLATFLQLRVAGRWLREAAPGGAGLRRSLLEAAPREAPPETTGDPESPVFPAPGRLFRLAPAGAAPFPSAPPRGEAPRPQAVFMSADSGGEGRGPRPEGAKIIFLEAYRTGRRRSDPTPRRVEPPRDADALEERMAQAGEAEHWLETLRHAMITWHPIASRRSFAAEFHTIAARLRRHPDYVTTLLGHLAVREPPAAKTLLVLLDLAPSHSWLRGDRDVQRSLRLRAADVLEEESLRDAAQVLHSRFLAATRTAGRMDPASREAGEALWRERLRHLPAALLPALADVTLGDGQFLFLTRRLGLHSAAVPD